MIISPNETVLIGGQSLTNSTGLDINIASVRVGDGPDLLVQKLCKTVRFLIENGHIVGAEVWESVSEADAPRKMQARLENPDAL